MLIKFLTLWLCLIPMIVYAVPVNLTWKDNSDNEEFFEIQRRIGTSEWTWIARIPMDKESYVDQGQPGASHCYRLSAVNIVGASDFSNEACLTIEFLPDNPTDLRAK